jgi:hypothetical protein
VCYLLEQLLIEGGEHLEVLHQNFHRLGPIMHAEPTINSTKIDSDNDQGPRAALKWVTPIKSLKVLLLADLKKDLHGVSVVFHLGEAAEVLLHLIPLPPVTRSSKYFILK